MLATFVLWIIFLDVPEPTSDWLDASWQTALVDSHIHQRAFGREIAFTFGPWGFLTSHFYPVEGLPLKFIWEGLGKFLLVAGVVALSTPLPRVRHWLLIAELALFGMLFNDTLGMVFLTFAVIVGLMRENLPRWALVGLIVAMALLSTMKFTFCLLSVTGVTLAAASLAVRRHWARALALPSGFAGAFLGWWLAVGQNPDHLLAYFRASREISAGYGWGMSVDESWPVFFAGAGLVIFNLMFAVQTARAATPDRRAFVWPALLFLCATWGLAWKHGYTRADGHVLGFFYFCLLVARAVPSWFLPDRRWSWFDVSLPLCLFGLWIGDPGLFKQTPRLLAHHWIGNTHELANLGTFRARFEARLRQEQAKFDQPALRAAIGRGTVDWLSYEQGILFLNGLNYHPRPVFQSYSAYTPKLMAKNLRFLQSTKAPDFIVLRLQPIDERFPSQEDALVLAELPRRYELVREDGDTLLFRRKSTPPAAMNFARVPAGTASPVLGEEIVLPTRDDHALWVQADFPLTRLGRLRALLYRPPILRMIVTEESGRQINFRVIPPIAAEGFLLQPFLETAADYAAFVRGQGPKSIRSIRFEPARPSEAEFWDRAAVRFYRVPELRAVPLNALQSIAAAGVANLAPRSVHSDVGVDYRTVRGKQVLMVHAPGEIVFTPSSDQRGLTGEFGLPTETHTGNAHTDGADFAIECEFVDGRKELLWQRRLDPGAHAPGLAPTGTASGTGPIGVG